MPNVPLADIVKTPGIKLLDPVPKAQTQEGPTCGFYALSIVMLYWRDKYRDQGIVAPAARKRDLRFQSDEVRSGLSPGESLRHLGGKEPGSSARSLGKDVPVHPGGVYTAAQLGQVAKAVRGVNEGVQYEVKIERRETPDGFKDELVAAIDSEIPPIVAFNVHEGDPAAQAETHAHWGVVIGYYKHEGDLWFAATHGHGKYYRWTARALVEGNFNLQGRSSGAYDYVKTKAKFKEQRFDAWAKSIVEQRPEEEPTIAALRLRNVKETRTQWKKPDAFAKAKEKPLMKYAEVKTTKVEAVKMDLAHYVILVRPNLAEKK